MTGSTEGVPATSEEWRKIPPEEVKLVPPPVVKLVPPETVKPIPPDPGGESFSPDPGKSVLPPAGDQHPPITQREVFPMGLGGRHGPPPAAGRRKEGPPVTGSTGEIPPTQDEWRGVPPEVTLVPMPANEQQREIPATGGGRRFHPMGISGRVLPVDPGERGKFLHQKGWLNQENSPNNRKTAANSSGMSWGSSKR